MCFPSVLRRVDAGSQQETDSSPNGHDSQIIHSPGSLHVNSAQQPCICVAWNTGPSIHEPTRQGKRAARHECHCMKETSVKSKAEWKPPCHSACLEKLQGNIQIIKKPFEVVLSLTCPCSEISVVFLGLPPIPSCQWIWNVSSPNVFSAMTLTKQFNTIQV